MMCNKRYCVFLLFIAVSATASELFDAQRQQMVREIEADVRETANYIGVDSLDPRVMQAMNRVPRHQFVPLGQIPYAYENRPLPIGHGQTISQPYIVALMTHLLQVDEHAKVLEIGTGSGYQAAILAQLAHSVYTIEIVEPLGRQAQLRFQLFGYQNVTSKIADGYYGWQAQAPFDVIIVTAAGDHIPPPLIRQLKPGGRMIIPIGGRFSVQQLLQVEKTPDGKIITRQVLPVRFVPITGDH